MPAVNVKFESFDVLIDRRSPYGNPYIIGRDGSRDEVCDKHRVWLWSEIRSGRLSLEALAALKGKRLGCHCAPRRCHGDALSAAADWAHEMLQDRKKGS